MSANCNSPAKSLQDFCSIYFIFVAQETICCDKTKIKTFIFYCSIYFMAALVPCAMNAAIYFIAAFILFYCT